MNYLLASNFLGPKEQLRFCTTCRFEFLNFLTGLVDGDMAFADVFLDVHRAPHMYLISKGSYFGIIDPLPLCFLSYLTQRSQTVSNDDITSNPGAVTIDVIWGNVLATCYPLCILMTHQFQYLTVSLLLTDDMKIKFPLKLNVAGELRAIFPCLETL